MASSKQLDRHFSKTPKTSSVNGPHAMTRMHASVKRPRAPIACFRCHHKKVRCDGVHPNCTRCLSTGVLCAYPSSRRARNTQPVNVDPFIDNLSHLEARIHRIESDLESQCSILRTLFASQSCGSPLQQSRRTGGSANDEGSTLGFGPPASMTNNTKSLPSPSPSEMAADLVSQMRKTEQEVQESRSILAQIRLRSEQRIARGKRGTPSSGTSTTSAVSPVTANNGNRSTAEANKSDNRRTSSTSSMSSSTSSAALTEQGNKLLHSPSPCTFVSNAAGLYTATASSFYFAPPGHPELMITSSSPSDPSPYLLMHSPLVNRPTFHPSDHCYDGTSPLVTSTTSMINTDWSLFNSLPHTPLGENEINLLSHLPLANCDGNDSAVALDYNHPGQPSEHLTNHKQVNGNPAAQTLMPLSHHQHHRQEQQRSHDQQRPMLLVDDGFVVTPSSSTHSSLSASSSTSQGSFAGQGQQPLDSAEPLSQFIVDETLSVEPISATSASLNPYNVF